MSTTNVHTTDSSLGVWFLHVGHGDCTIVRHPDGRVTVVDTHLRKPIGCQALDLLGNLCGAGDVVSFITGLGADRERGQLDEPLAALRALGAAKIHRLVLTHPDLDHLRGLALLAATYPIDCVWDSLNAKWIRPDQFVSVEDSVDWMVYLFHRLRLTRTSVQSPVAGGRDEWSLHDGIEILSPSAVEILEANARQRWNTISYVIRVWHGGASVLLPGDADAAVLRRLVSAHGERLRSTVLKAPHHGRRSCFCPEFVEAVAPELIVASSGALAPSHDGLRMYAKHSRVVSTAECGTVDLRLQASGAWRMRTPVER